jgi:hypothetical protein
MALPSSGIISASQIAAELELASTNISLKGMATSASFSAPYAYSDFYDYSQITWYYGSTSGNVKASQACDDTTTNEGRIVKGSGNTSNAPEVGDTMLSGIPNGGGNIIQTGTLFLPTNLSSFGPPPGGLAQNKVIKTDTNGVITSVYQCT